MAKRKKDYSYNYKHLDIIEKALTSCGYEIITRDQGLILARGKRLYVRVMDDIFQFAMRKSFDRWANSVDFSYSGMVCEEELAKKVIKSAEEQADLDNYDEGQAQNVDLFDLMKER